MKLLLTVWNGKWLSDPSSHGLPIFLRCLRLPPNCVGHWPQSWQVNVEQQQQLRQAGRDNSRYHRDQHQQQPCGNRPSLCHLRGTLRSLPLVCPGRNSVWSMYCCCPCRQHRCLPQKSSHPSISSHCLQESSMIPLLLPLCYLQTYHPSVENNIPVVISNDLGLFMRRPWQLFPNEVTTHHSEVWISTHVLRLTKSKLTIGCHVKIVFMDLFHFLSWLYQSGRYRGTFNYEKPQTSKSPPWFASKWVSVWSSSSIAQCRI